MTDTPLSPLHAMLATVQRADTADFANAVSNHPAIYPAVHGNHKGPIDLTDPIADRANFIALTGEHGFQLYARQPTGQWEVHTSVLPEGRGAWTLMFVRACLHWMFTRTDAVEIFTRVPKGNLGARALAHAIGGKYEATRQNGWVQDYDPIPADIFGLGLVDWSRTAPGLTERGHWFHERLEAEYARHGCADPSPHPDDAMHDRQAGLAVEMFLHGKAVKGVSVYNRWAAMSGYAAISLKSLKPVTVDIQDAVLVIPERGDFFAATVAKAPARRAA